MKNSFFSTMSDDEIQIRQCKTNTIFEFLLKKIVNNKEIYEDIKQ